MPVKTKNGSSETTTAYLTTFDIIQDGVAVIDNDDDDDLSI